MGNPQRCVTGPQEPTQTPKISTSLSQTSSRKISKKITNSSSSMKKALIPTTTNIVKDRGSVGRTGRTDRSRRLSLGNSLTRDPSTLYISVYTSLINGDNLLIFSVGDVCKLVTFCYSK